MTKPTLAQPKERPILFSGAMVNAILAGEKTQTRRVIKRCRLNFRDREAREQLMDRCPYGEPGDRLWVRETWCHKIVNGCCVYNSLGNLDSSCTWYRADGKEVVKVDGDGFQEFGANGKALSPWHPSIHMPRLASRITLEILDVRVERVQDITDADAVAEGVRKHLQGYWPYGIKTNLTVVVDGAEVPAQYCSTAKHSFACLWDSINVKRGFGWYRNPWVWVLTFRRMAEEAGE